MKNKTVENIHDLYKPPQDAIDTVCRYQEGLNSKNIYDVIWYDLISEDNPTEFISNVLSQAASNSQDRLVQLANYLAGLLRFYYENPSEFAKLLDDYQQHQDVVLDIFDLTVKEAISTQSKPSSENLDLQYVVETFLDKLAEIIDHSVSLDNSITLTYTPDEESMNAWINIKQEVAKIREYEPFTDSELANIIINIALTRMAQHLAEKHKQAGEVEKYKLFLNKVFRLRFPKEGEQMEWKKIAAEMQKDQEFSDINIGKSDSAIYNHFTTLHRQIISISERYELNLEIEKHQTGLTGKL